MKVLPLAAMFAALPFAALPFAARAAGPETYDACLARTQSDPAGALAQASAWEKQGGGAAADHCAALALVGLRRYAEAASRLDALARSSFADEPSRKTALFDQAGNAWLLADRADSAIASFTAALSADPYDTDLLADRARALALKQDWSKAESDLSAALLVSPDRADLYVLRGSARHAMGRKPDARADFDRALRLQPGNADALVERGDMKLEAGDAPGARADWQAAISSAPASPAADGARHRLADSVPGH
ncbi:MAG TPA: tetratricopeptide repeat protein [Rhizomicrobium sp.]|nr:tetratricopeptide repeat protein [Rhizomicrobium sp.]